MLKIYVAGKWKEREKVRSIMDMFESRGHIITCDWTKHIAPEKIDKDHDWAQNGHKTYAEEDLEGVKNCDILVAYMPDPDVFYKGAWIEIGIALGLNKKVIIIGKDITTVFLGLPNVIVVQFKEDALELVDNVNSYNRYHRAKDDSNS